MRHILKIPLAAAAAVLATAAITLPGAAPASAATPLGEIELGHVLSGFTLYAHAHGSYIQVTSESKERQSWDTVNGKGWRNLSGTWVPVAEIQLTGTNLCVNAASVSQGYGLYLDSCVYGDNNELFWFRQYSSYDQWNIVSVVGTDANKIAGYNMYSYMTAGGFYDFALVVLLGPGQGQKALWAPADPP